MNRIISKEKEREDPKRDSSKTSFQLESKSVSSVSTRNPASYKLILYTELILQEIQGSSYAGLLQQLFPVYPSILHGRIKSPSILQCSKRPAVILGPYSTGMLPVILTGRNSILHSSHPPRAPYSDSQAQST